MPSADYITIDGRAEASFTERRSEFIGYIKHTSTEEEATAFINEIRVMHRKATHNVYAYILRSTNTGRYSDDGEPQGTAGVPVLEVLKKEGLTDICCVVTRYFGGILLGGGGLVRAYSHAAKIAADSAKRRIMRSCLPLNVTADYNLYGRLLTVLPEFEAKITDTRFEAEVCISLICPEILADALTEKLIDLANGRIIVKKGEICYADFA